VAENPADAPVDSEDCALTPALRSTVRRDVITTGTGPTSPSPLGPGKVRIGVEPSEQEPAALAIAPSEAFNFALAVTLALCNPCNHDQLPFKLNPVENDTEWVTDIPALPEQVIVARGRDADAALATLASAALRSSVPVRTAWRRVAGTVETTVSRLRR